MPILAGGAAVAAMGLFLLLFMPENGFKPTRPEDRNSFQHMGDIFKKGLNMVRSRPVLLSVLGIGFIYGLYSEGWDRLWVKYLVDNFTLPSVFGMNEVAFFGFLRAGGMLLSILATRQVEKRLDANHAPSIARATLWITVLLSGAILTFAFSPALAVSIIAVTAVSILRNIMGPLYSAWVNQRLDSDARATVLSMSRQGGAWKDPSAACDWQCLPSARPECPVCFLRRIYQRHDQCHPYTYQPGIPRKISLCRRAVGG